MSLKLNRKSWIFQTFEKIPIRQKLILVFILVFGATLIAFSIFSFQFLARSLEREFDDALYNYAVDVSEAVTLDLQGDLEVSIPHFDRLKVYPFSLGRALIQIRHRSGKILNQEGETLESLNIPFEREFAKLGAGEDKVYRTILSTGLEKPEANRYRVVSLAIDNSPSPDFILQIAAPMSFLEVQLENRRLIFFILIPMILLLTTGLSYWLAKKSFEPIKVMIAQAQTFTALALSQRVPLPAAKDELHQLATALNLMLERLELSFKSQDRFVADASHQLQTPLALLRAELEEIAAKTQISFRGVFDEIDSLSKLIKHLLILARMDQAGDFPFALVQFDELVFEVSRKLNRNFEDKKIRLKVSFDPKFEIAGGPQVMGDEELLKTLVFNLVENAWKYSPENSTVQLRLSSEGENLIFEVEDEGPGVAVEDQTHLFQRFFRSTEEKIQKVPGFGLGLSLVQTIAQLHHGNISLQNNPTRGALFRFQISLAASSDVSALI